MNYAETTQGMKYRTYRITVKSTSAHQPEEIKQILKTKINLGEIKVGIRSVKSFRGGVQIEMNSKEETDILGKEIQRKCGKDWIHIYTR